MFAHRYLFICYAKFVYFAGPTNGTEISYLRREIFEFLKSQLNESVNAQCGIIEADASNKLQGEYVMPKHVKESLRQLIMGMKKKWKEASRCEKYFLEKFHDWLNVPFTIATVDECAGSPETTSGGRPSTLWSDLSDRSKRRRTEKVRAEHGVDELAFATQMAMRSAKQLDALKASKSIQVPEICGTRSRRGTDTCRSIIPFSGVQIIKKPVQWNLRGQFK
jgi:hypothetical protein